MKESLEILNILVIEENKTQAQVIREFLDKSGHEIFCAENDMASLKAAKTDSIDLILLNSSSRH